MRNPLSSSVRPRPEARLWTVVLVSIAVLLLLAAPAGAQIQFAFEFSFSNPGARSLGFGGAFVALADDATAAFANPAGLVQLVAPEVSVEGRSWSYSTPYTYSGRASGEPTGLGLDTDPGVRRRRSESDASGLSFLAFVYPKKKWSVAFYRHQLARFEFAHDTQGIFASGTAASGLAAYLDTVRLSDTRSSTDLEIVTHGVAGAFRVSEKLSFGLGLSHFEGMVRVRSDLFWWDEDTREAFFAESSFLPERRFFDTSLAADDRDWGLTAGFLWQPVERWQMGGFFRQGPELRGAFEVLVGPSLGPFGVFFPEPPGSLITVPTAIAFPDVYGLGAAYRSPGGRLTVSFEWDRVLYSAILESLQEITRRDPRFNFRQGSEDGDELHLGAEYAFLRSGPLFAVRAGVWLDPDHAVRTFNGNALDRAVLPPGDDELHVALGFGVAFERFQIDLGADFSDLRDTVSVSAIYNF